MSCSIKYIFDWITFGVLLCYAVFAFINLCVKASATASYGIPSSWVNDWIIMFYFMFACILTACAPFGWIPFIETYIKYLNVNVWRSSFIIILACFYFPNAGNSWNNILCSLFSVLTLALGLLFLIVDLIVVCKNSCKYQEEPSGSMLDGFSVGSAKANKGAIVQYKVQASKPPTLNSPTKASV